MSDWACRYCGVAIEEAEHGFVWLTCEDGDSACKNGPVGWHEPEKNTTAREDE